MVKEYFTFEKQQCLYYYKVSPLLGEHKDNLQQDCGNDARLLHLPFVHNSLNLV